MALCRVISVLQTCIKHFHRNVRNDVLPLMSACLSLDAEGLAPHCTELLPGVMEIASAQTASASLSPDTMMNQFADNMAAEHLTPALLACFEVRVESLYVPLRTFVVANLHAVGAVTVCRHVVVICMMSMPLAVPSKRHAQQCASVLQQCRHPAGRSEPVHSVRTLRAWALPAQRVSQAASA